LALGDGPLAVAEQDQRIGLRGDADVAQLAALLSGADVGFHVFAVAMGAFGGLYEHSGYDFSLALSGRGIAAKLAPLLSSRAHAEHHARGNVSFSDGFGSSSLCDTFLRTRWDLVRAKQRRSPATPTTTEPAT